MPTLPGRCINDMYCSLAASGEIVRVPAEGRYVCPHCGKTLVSPTAPIRSRRRRARGNLLGVLLVVGGFVGGMVIGGIFVWSSEGRLTVLSSKPLRAGVAQQANTLLQPVPIMISAGPRGHGHRRR